MPANRLKIVTCKALAPVLEPLAAPGVECTAMDIGLHLKPEHLREKLLETVAALEGPDVTIALGYGLCGRGLEGVRSAKSTLVLPRVDDCVGALLGSRARHRRILSERAGCYFLEPRWLDSELNIFEQMKKGMDRIPAARRKELIKAALHHYDALALLRGTEQAEEAFGRCRELSDEYGLELLQFQTDLGLLRRLLNGPWTDEEFVIAPPGSSIPLF